MSDTNVHSWRAEPEDERLLAALESANVEKSESARVRAGLRLLAKRNKVKL